MEHEGGFKNLLPCAFLEHSVTPLEQAEGLSSLC